jgi:hypothetical protein
LNDEDEKANAKGCHQISQKGFYNEAVQLFYVVKPWEFHICTAMEPLNFWFIYI